jgi:hypothetical protein
MLRPLLGAYAFQGHVMFISAANVIDNYVLTRSQGHLLDQATIMHCTVSEKLHSTRRWLFLLAHWTWN